jgi:outer membrane lipoprotein SlyB
VKVKGEASGVGAVAGAVVGGVAGHQVGDGRGQDVATVAGAIGGGIAGNEIEKRVKGSTYYHVTVAMENGTTNTVDVDAMNGLSTGSKVRVVGNSLQFAG